MYDVLLSAGYKQCKNQVREFDLIAVYPFYNLSFKKGQTNSNIIFRTSNVFGSVHLLMIKLEQLNFDFEQTDIEMLT